mmetsp:Transcript_14117/g.53049  ORF Transcript_14117/g.53049 Transcript_14117/m.53049 type:complete len:442 (-) Transcript_14117:71-1396(-)
MHGWCTSLARCHPRAAAREPARGRSALLARRRLQLVAIQGRAIFVSFLPHVDDVLEAAARLASEVAAEEAEELVDAAKERVHGVVREAPGHDELADGHGEDEAGVVLDAVPVPVGVEEQVARLDVGVLQGQVRQDVGHVVAEGLHADLAVDGRLHVEGVLGVHEVPAFLADHEDEPVAGHRAVPAGARGESAVVDGHLLLPFQRAILAAMRRHELRRLVGQVVGAPEALVDAVEVQVVLHHLVDVLGHLRGGVVGVEEEAGLDGEEQRLGLRAVADAVEGVPKAQGYHLMFGHGQRRVLVHGHGEMAHARGQIVRTVPVLHAFRALEQALDQHRLAPVLRRSSQLLIAVVFGAHLRNLRRLVRDALVQAHVLAVGVNHVEEVPQRQMHVGEHVAHRFSITPQAIGAEQHHRAEEVHDALEHHAQSADLHAGADVRAVREGV